MLLAASLALALAPPGSSSGVVFRPSSINWANWTIYHPPATIRALPTGPPRAPPLGRVQFDLAAAPGRRWPDEVAAARRQAVRDVFLRGWTSYRDNA